MVNIHLGERSSWKVTGGGVAVDIEVQGLGIGAESGVSFGGGGFAIDFVSEAHSAHAASANDDRFLDNTYRAYFAYAEAEIGVGLSVLGPVSVSGGTPSMHADGGYVRRVGALAPDASGELGDPTGLLGPAATISVNKTHDAGQAVGAGYIVCGPPHGIVEQTAAQAARLISQSAGLLLQFKYGAPYWGVSLSSSIAAGAAVQVGAIVGIQNLKNNRWVQRGRNTFL